MRLLYGNYAMRSTQELIQELNQSAQSLFHKQQTILSFGGFLERVMARPEALMRNATQYLFDTVDYFDKYELRGPDRGVHRWKIFDIGTERNIPVIGNENVQEEIYQTLASFVRQGYSNKLILLHGPNGSAKTSMIDSISNAMRQYSETDDGAIYRFNWIFPTDKTATPQAHGEGPIGFAGGRRGVDARVDDVSFAFTDERKIASKIPSEFKENPIFLIPMPQREIWLREWVGKARNIKPEDVELPPHILHSGLSKRNQQIFQQLMTSYEGNLAMVLRHIQVERFYFSKQYRVGISTVEPQMSIDAMERQLTMDRNIANLPNILHNIAFHDTMGPLVEANRGILEFSDFLKRPVEAFKYLLSTVEKGTLNLPSSTAMLDIVFFATTNEKHLDAFKMLPDFQSFRSRMELITAPYLLRPAQEAKIYEADLRAIAKLKPITPHAVDMLCMWAVMTRLKQPDPEYFDTKHRALIARLDPPAKAKLYDNQPLGARFKQHDEQQLQELRREIMNESQNVLVYEGRFGASPREIRTILYRASQDSDHASLTPMAIFDQLEKIVKDRSVYEFLQIEPRGEYHQAGEFIKVIKDEFARIFEHEVINAMTLVEDIQYENLFHRYVEHVVAHVKREKLYNKITGSYEAPSEKIMQEVEKILEVSIPVDKHRENLIGRVAAYKIDHPNETLSLTAIFPDFLETISQHYYRERQKVVDSNFVAMMKLETPDDRSLSERERDLAKTTYAGLSTKFGYDMSSARECLRFLLGHRGQQKA